VPQKQQQLHRSTYTGWPLSGQTVLWTISRCTPVHRQ